MRECDGMKCEYAVSDQAKARMRTQIKFMTRLFDYPKKRLLNQADLLECEGIPTRKKTTHSTTTIKNIKCESFAHSLVC